MVSHVEMSNYEKLGCLHDLFVKQANKTPDKVAVVTTDQQKITFSELNAVTDILAEKLRSLGVGRNKIVGIFMERSLEYTISYIAILKAGGAYFPIEMSYPLPLIQSVLEDSQPTVICTKSSYKHLLNTAIPTLCLNGDWIDDFEKQNQKNEIKPEIEKVLLDDMAYTVYSSGTTGKPKGIQCPHRGAVFSYIWRHRAFPYDEDDREACNIFFVWEMLRPLLKGIPLYIIPDTVIYDPPKLLSFLKENKITRMLFTPSLLQTVLDTQEASLTESFKTMKQIWLCGEVVTTTLRNRITKAFPWVKILNLYSISECHDVACSDLTEGLGLEGRSYCPVGKIFDGVHVVVMDEKYNVKLIGDAGEVYVGGPTLAIGYLNRPDLNEQKFIKTPSPLVNSYGPRLYRTGDWGYLLSDGSLEVVGRCDSMVKIRGYTIELQAVENALLNIPEVNMACAVINGEEGSDKFLVAYIVLLEGCPKNIGELRSKLRGQLPFYMIPSQFIFLEKIPILDSSGKINKKELPPVRGFSEDDINVENFSDELEKSIAKIWCNVLKINTLDATDNFFDLGGHSLLAAITISQINDLFNINLSTLDLYTNSTFELLSKKVRTGKSNPNILNLTKEVEKFSIKHIPNIKLRMFWKSVNIAKEKFHRGNVLLTGVTGYLGSFLLKYLLENTKTTVYCLVRSSSTENSNQRLEKILEARNISKEYLNTRITSLSGDISLNKFGLEEIDYLTLSYDIDYVIHCAAQVNLVLPFNALYNSNVTGTHNIVTFCLEKKLKPVHYISTSDVFAENMKECAENLDMTEHVDKLQYGYAQTKWLSEQIIFSASKNGLPTIVSRCGNIGGSQFSPVWNENDLILLILKGVILTKSAPNIAWKVELTPVEFISEYIVKLTLNITKLFGKVFHFINSNTMNSKVLWSFLQEFNYDVDLISYEKWSSNVFTSAKKFKQLESLVHLLNTRLSTSSYLEDASTFKQDNLNDFLSIINAEYPSFNEFLLKKYINHLITGGYIPPPPTSPPVTSFCQESLKNRIALVTGASSGLGKGIAVALAKSGITTIAVARRIEMLNNLQANLKLKNINNFIPLKMDVTNKEEVFSCVSYIKSNIGPINILINNAGIMEYCKMIDCETDLWMTMVDVNCKGFLNMIGAVLPHMKNIGSGHIINITSDAGRKPFAGLAVYSGTKYFEEVVSEAMRQEISSHKIKVTCIEPGDILTGLHEKSKNQDVLQEFGAKIEFLKIEDVANTVLFVLNQSSNCSINNILIEPIEGPI